MVIVNSFLYDAVVDAEKTKKKLLHNLFFAFLVVVISFSLPPISQVGAQSSFWDRCEALSAPERYWVTDISGISLSIDTSVKSPLGTGSIKATVSSGVRDMYVDEWFTPDARLPFQDFTISRPTSVFVQGSRTTEWRIEVVTREPSGRPWKTHVVARQTVPANTMTEIRLNYSDISTAALKMTCAVSVIAKLNRQSFTGYISGLTEQDSDPQPPATPTLLSPGDGVTLTDSSVTFTWSSSIGATDYELEVTGPTSLLQTVASPTYVTSLDEGAYTWRVRSHNAIGYSGWAPIWSFTVDISQSDPNAIHTEGNLIKNELGQTIWLRGFNFLWGEDDPTFGSTFSASWNPGWSETQVRTTCNFLKQNNFNFIKINTRLLFFHDNAQGFNTQVHNILNIALEYGIYVEFVNWGIAEYWPSNPYGPYSSYRGTMLPYEPYMNPYDKAVCPDISTFNNLLGEMATVLKDHPNAILGLWNEPTIFDQSRYDLYWEQIPISLTAIRNAGFNGIVAVMGEVAFAPGTNQFSGMGWAIDHLDIFTGTYGSVVADYHAFYTYLHQSGSYPDSYDDLYNYWFTTGRIQEAMNNGICVIHSEDGMTSRARSREKQAVENALTMLKANNIGWAVHSFTKDREDTFSVLSRGTTLSFNSRGEICASVAS